MVRKTKSKKKANRRPRLRIFISHSDRDKMAVDKIAQRLRAEGFGVWDNRSQLKAGDNVQRTILGELEQSNVLLIIVSENSFRSESAQQEFATIVLQQEITKGSRRIIPIKIDGISMPSYLAHLQYLDFSQDFEVGMDRLVADLRLTKAALLASAQAAAGTGGDRIDSQVRTLRKALEGGRLTLVCGAGISVKAGIPLWGDLLVRLLDRMLEKLSKNPSLEIGKNTAVEFQKIYGGGSSLIIGKYLKNNLGEDFASETREALYAANTRTSDLIDSIVRLARPQRDAKPLDSIITFNFDCLVEEALDKNAVANRPIFSESIKHDGNQLPVYHVHGYLPRSGAVPKTDLVFSEDAYHSQFIDAFSWSNLIQLSKLTQNTCLFIGISLTDPNMRRLLDVAWRKNPDKIMSHFIIKKRPEHPRESSLERVSKLLEEQDANALGLNIIWVDSTDEIPSVLNRIS